MYREEKKGGKFENEATDLGQGDLFEGAGPVNSGGTHQDLRSSGRNVPPTSK